MLFGYFQCEKESYINRLPLSQDFDSRISQELLEQRKAFFFDHGEELPKEEFCVSALESRAVISKLEFDDPDGFLNATQNPLQYAMYKDPKELRNLKAVFAANPENNEEILIQLIEPRRLMLPKTGWFLFKALLDPNAEGTFKETEEAGFHLDNKLTAVYEGNTLYFKSYFQVNKIFELSEYLIEASDDKVKEFLNLPCIFSENPEQDLSEITNSQRRKIAKVMALGFVKKYSTQEIIRRINLSKNKIAIEECDGKIKFPTSNNDKGRLLKFLGNEIMASYLDDEKDYECEGVRPISDK